MKKALQILFLTFAVSLLAVYISTTAIIRSFQSLETGSFQSETMQQKDYSALPQRFWQRQKVLFRQRQQEFQYGLKLNSQKLQKKLQPLKNRFRNMMP